MFFEVKTVGKNVFFFLGISKNACLTKILPPMMLNLSDHPLVKILKKRHHHGCFTQSRPSPKHPESHLQLQVLQRWPVGPQKETRTYSIHPFSEAKMLVSERVNSLYWGWVHPTLQCVNPYYWGDDYPVIIIWNKLRPRHIYSTINLFGNQGWIVFKIFYFLLEWKPFFSSVERFLECIRLEKDRIPKSTYFSCY